MRGAAHRDGGSPYERSFIGDEALIVAKGACKVNREMKANLLQAQNFPTVNGGASVEAPGLIISVIAIVIVAVIARREFGSKR